MTRTGVRKVLIPPGKAERDARIVLALGTPALLREIAEHEGLTVGSISLIGRRLCPDVMDARLRRPERGFTYDRKPKRNAALVEALKGEQSLKEIAKDFGVSTPRVYELGERLCPEIMKARLKGRHAERNAAIVKALSDPVPLRLVAAKFGLSTMHIHTIGSKLCPDVMAQRSSRRAA